MADINFGVNILPKTNSAYNLGSSTQKWNLYANTINGTSVDSIINGSILPTASSGYNGKVLGIVNGKWDRMSLLSTYVTRPSYIAESVKDTTLMGQLNDLRANKLAFLPSDQIIIEKTTDGGVTWEDAGISLADKVKLFSEARPTINLPRINNERSTLCGLRITFTAMKYDVPENTPETARYNYWNSDYVISRERYCSLRELYFWIGSNGDKINIRVQRAAGNDSNNWKDLFNNNDALFAGWSGNAYIQFDTAYTFGGSTVQVAQNWNYRIIFMSALNANAENFAYTGTQGIYEIKGYGPSWWGGGNSYAQNDHLYSYDYTQSATFPNNIRVMGNLYKSNGSFYPKDIQLNGTSILNDGIANIPLATTTSLGVVMTSGNFTMDSNGKLWINNASDNNVKEGTSGTSYLTPSRQHMATFYGLAKAAGDSTQASSSNAVGTYTSGAKTAIRSMLGIESSANFVEEISTSVVTITGVPNTKYVCGEVSTITITPPASGTIDVWFTSGTTPAVLTTTAILPEWFDDDNLEADTIYEIVITDGFGGIATWPVPVVSS